MTNPKVLSDEQPLLLGRMAEALKRLREDLQAHIALNQGLSELASNREQRIQQIKELLLQVRLPYREPDVVGQVAQLVHVHNELCRQIAANQESSKSEPLQKEESHAQVL